MQPEIYDQMENTARLHWWYQARFTIISNVLRRYAEPATRILDYGAGVGVYAAQLRDMGWHVVAADVYGPALAACRQKGLDVLDLEREALPARAFDAVLLGDVLEHLPDDEKTLSTIAGAVKHGGVVIATVPAFEFLWSGQDYVSSHLRRYTRKEIVRLNEHAKLSHVFVSYYNAFLFPAVVAAILAKRVFRPRDMYRTDLTPTAPWKNELLRRIFAAEAPLLGRVPFPIGASIISVARVP